MGSLISVALFSLLFDVPDCERPAANVVIVVIDGLRTHEVFDGAKRALMGSAGGVECEQGLVDRSWRSTVQGRREALMPFLWGTIAAQGQVFGNAKLGAPMKVSNTKRLSYPGYNELLTGVADPVARVARPSALTTP